MSALESIISSSPDDLETAERALIQRPRESIRLRLAMLFMMTFLLICIVAGAALIFLSKLGVKQQFIEKADNYAVQIQQARRFEKNFLLYGTGLEDALASTDNALQLFNAAHEEFRRVIGQKAYTGMADNLNHYNELLTLIKQIQVHADRHPTAQLSVVQGELRRCGALLVTEAADAVDKERLRFHHWLHSAKITSRYGTGAHPTRRSVYYLLYLQTNFYTF